MENKKDIPGFEGLYYATTDGKIFSYAKTWQSGMYHNRVESHPERELKQSFSKVGYKVVSLCNNGSRRLYKVHRLIALTFLTNPENKPTVNHINGNKTDNRVENLEWATILENNVHAYKAGLKVLPKGADSNCAKFNHEEAKHIKESDETIRSLAERYNVSTTTIRRIKSGKRYAA